MERRVAERRDSRPGESTALALPSTPPGTYWTGTRERRWTVSGTVTSRTRREWLRMMSAVGAGVLVDRLLPRRLAYAAADRQDPLAAFRAQLGAIPIQALAARREPHAALRSRRQRGGAARPRRHGRGGHVRGAGVAQVPGVAQGTRACAGEVRDRYALAPRSHRQQRAAPRRRCDAGGARKHQAADDPAAPPRRARAGLAALADRRPAPASLQGRIQARGERRAAGGDARSAGAHGP